MIGKGAPADFIQNLEELAKTHHADMALDNIRAYYFGQRFIVEMEVVLPSAMTVRESHDIALILQHKVRLPVEPKSDAVCFGFAILIVRNHSGLG